MNGKQFRKWRKGRKLSQKKAAELLGLKPRMIQYYEKGEREGGATRKTLIDDLPLFAMTATPVPQPVKASKLEETLADIIPDELTPREALDLLYKLKEAAKN